MLTSTTAAPPSAGANHIKAERKSIHQEDAASNGAEAEPEPRAEERAESGLCEDHGQQQTARSRPSREHA